MGYLVHPYNGTLFLTPNIIVYNFFYFFNLVHIVLLCLLCFATREVT